MCRQPDAGGLTAHTHSPQGEEGGTGGWEVGAPPVLRARRHGNGTRKERQKVVLRAADEGAQDQHGFKVDCACRWGRTIGPGEKGGRGFSPRSRLSEISANGN